jgi:hypothetical protein
MKRRQMWVACCAALLSVCTAVKAAPVGTAITYQGSLEDGGGPVTNTSPGCRFEFRLWDDPVAGSPIGFTLGLGNVSVDGGVFTVDLDFGAGAFNGQARWLEISVCCPGPVCFLETLTPRVELTPVPYALHAPGGGNTLDQAYDQGGPGAGRIITADSGPLRIEGNDGLEVLRTIRSGNSITINGATGNEQISSSASLNLNVASGRALRLEDNATSPNLIGGYSGNTVTAGVRGATIGGGGLAGNINRVTDDHGTVGGGRNNQAGDNAGTASDAGWATVSGGWGNTAGEQYATVGGGFGNTSGGYVSTVAGGQSNQAMGIFSSVCGGSGNEATAAGINSTIGGGINNTTFGIGSTVSGGGDNYAYGSSSIVAGGLSNLSGGDYSFAGGKRAKVRDGNPLSPFYAGTFEGDKGTFMWADSTFADFVSTGPNQFLVRAAGGMYFGTNSTVSIPAGRFINTSTGGYLTTGGTWTNASDRNEKKNLSPVDPREVLERVSALGIARWNYKSEADSTQHVGPMAQDFHAAFGLGDSDKSIATIDADGVALAAIQGLYQIVQEKDCDIEELRAEIDRLEALVSTLVEREGGAQ